MILGEVLIKSCINIKYYLKVDRGKNTTNLRYMTWKGDKGVWTIRRSVVRTIRRTEKFHCNCVPYWPLLQKSEWQLLVFSITQCRSLIPAN